MTAPAADAVSETAAMTVIAPTVGACATAVTTTAETIILSDWVGRYVKIYVENADFYYAFIGLTAAGAAASTALVTAQAAVGTAAVVDRIYQGIPINIVVPKSKPVIKFRTVTGTTGVIRIIPS